MTDPIDVSAILKPGVYLLSKAGRVVYVGKARCLLVAIAARKNLSRNNIPTWVPVPRITFDEIQIFPCDAVRAVTLQKALITLHNPHHNRPPREAHSPFVAPAPTASPSATPNPIRRL